MDVVIFNGQDEIIRVFGRLFERGDIDAGLGDAVLSALSTEGVRLHKMGIQEIAHSGKPAELLDHYGLSARAIIEKVKQLVK